MTWYKQGAKTPRIRIKLTHRRDDPKTSLEEICSILYKDSEGLLKLMKPDVDPNSREFKAEAFNLSAEVMIEAFIRIREEQREKE